MIIWQATAISYGGTHDTREPVYIKSIEIQGLRMCFTSFWIIVVTTFNSTMLSIGVFMLQVQN